MFASSSDTRSCTFSALLGSGIKTGALTFSDEMKGWKTQLTLPRWPAVNSLRSKAGADEERAPRGSFTPLHSPVQLLAVEGKNSTRKSIANLTLTLAKAIRLHTHLRFTWWRFYASFQDYLSVRACPVHRVQVINSLQNSRVLMWFTCWIISCVGDGFICVCSVCVCFKTNCLTGTKGDANLYWLHHHDVSLHGSTAVIMKSEGKTQQLSERSGG